MTLSNLPSSLLSEIANGSQSIVEIASNILASREKIRSGDDKKLKPIFETKLGRLFKGDCLDVLRNIENDSLDCVFADPPFNLKKQYDESTDDNMSDYEYMEWTRAWLDSCCEKLKPGGSLFVYNIPKWSVPTANYLQSKLTFKHWIAVDITFSMPIPGRLYPSHYSLLYFVKGSKPMVFEPPRTPIKTCVRCGQEQNDYGGYKMKMNPKGVNIRDVWTDIPPVRHSKYKNRDANELSLKLLDRVLDIATKPGDLVFDPFGGSGTTFIAAELKGRRWLGAELGDCEPIVDRFKSIDRDRGYLEKVRRDLNTLFTDKALGLRAKYGLPLDTYQISEEQIKRALGEIQQNLDI